jgi:predicted RND superfamily exporter protein
MLFDRKTERVTRFFSAVTEKPLPFLIVGMIVTVVSSAFLFGLKLDTSMEAFIQEDHPAVQRRDIVENTFGLSDPVVLAVVNNGKNGIFNPETLSLINWLTEEIADIPNVDPERITSLATENNIIGTPEGMEIEPFLTHIPASQEEANALKHAINQFPLYVGSIVSKDGTAALIFAELVNKEKNDNIYKELLNLAERAPKKNNETIHVAGDAAVSVYFGKYVFVDAMRMIPATFLVVSIIIFIAYRTFQSVVVTNMVVLAAVGIAVGLMAALGIPYYNITNALPVLLVAIGVADGIHIMGEYYELAALDPQAEQQSLVVRAMERMWWPVTVTSLTDMGGFLAIAAASYMKPMKVFGLFASVGVLVALVFSLLIIPSLLVLMGKKTSCLFQGGRTGVIADKFGRIMEVLGNIVAKKTYWAFVLIGLALLVGTYGAYQLRVDENRVENFQKNELIYKADEVINEKLDGTVFLDIFVETPRNEDLFLPENLKKIEELQEYFVTLPHVRKATSIVDYFKQINRAMFNNEKNKYSLPDTADMAAQYMLLYSSSSSSDALENFIDYDYRLANVRLTLNSGWYSDFANIIEKGSKYLESNFNNETITAKISGRADVDYNNVKGLVKSHFQGLFLAIIVVWLLASFFLRSLTAGAFALIPVLFAVLIIYAWMGITEIALDVSTSMFAAIAIGCGVDFAVHVIDRLILLVKHENKTLEEALAQFFPSTGRALFFNFCAVFFGFIVLTISQVPAISRFGILVCVAVFMSFTSSVIILPALLKAVRPTFLISQPNNHNKIGQKI